MERYVHDAPANIDVKGGKWMTFDGLMNAIVDSISSKRVVDTGEYVRFTDDHMFCTVMEDEEYCKEFLQRVLDIEISKLVYVSQQKYIRNRINSRGIRLDVYVVDTDGNTYNIEMQTTHETHLGKRIRYYHSEMDGYQIRKGKSYRELGKNIVIFVCTYDPFGDNRSVYTLKNKCIENDKIEIEDEILTVILNAQGERDGVAGGLKNLLDYIKTGESIDEYTEKLEAKVREINDDNDWRNRNMTFKMKLRSVYDDAYDDGLEQGIERGIEIIILDNLEEGKTENQIVSKLIKRFNLSEKQAKEYYNEFS